MPNTYRKFCLEIRNSFFWELSGSRRIGAYEVWSILCANSSRTLSAKNCQTMYLNNPVPRAYLEPDTGQTVHHTAIRSHQVSSSCHYSDFFLFYKNFSLIFFLVQNVQRYIFLTKNSISVYDTPFNLFLLMKFVQ